MYLSPQQDQAVCAYFMYVGQTELKPRM